jgi:hypothetical protein
MAAALANEMPDVVPLSSLWPPPEQGKAGAGGLQWKGLAGPEKLERVDRVARARKEAVQLTRGGKTFPTTTRCAPPGGGGASGGESRPGIARSGSPQSLHTSGNACTARQARTVGSAEVVFSGLGVEGFAEGFVATHGLAGPIDSAKPRAKGSGSSNGAARPG